MKRRKGNDLHEPARLQAATGKGDEMSAVMKQEGSEVLEQVVIQGDLSNLKPADRVMYYKQVCESLGLNPLTKPFEYIALNGKLTLYAKRDATEQLRKINGVSIIIKAREVVEGCYVVTAQATDKTGRHDESIGAVPIDNLKGEARSNALMKAETKAKRRVTLSICGLGLLDETEVSSIPGAYPEPQAGLPAAPINPTTGALAALTADQQTIVMETAEAIKAAFAEDKAMDGYALYSTSGFDNDAKVACWSLLPSEIRSALKRMHQAEEAAENGTISASQKKHLEALIKEYKLKREAVKTWCKAEYGKEHFKDLTPTEYADLEQVLKDMKAAAQESA